MERQLGRPPRAFRRVAVRCPFGRPAVTEQAPFDESGEPFPTTLLDHLPAPGGGDRTARGGRRRRALRPACPRGSGPGREPRARPRGAAPPAARASGRDRRPDAHRRAQVPARPRGLRARAARLRARRADPRRGRAALACSLLQRLASTPMEGTLESTRREWAEGYRRLQAAASDRRSTSGCSRRSTLVLEQLRRRVGQTFTLRRARLGLRRRRPLGAGGTAREREPAPGWPRTLDARPGRRVPPLFPRRASTTSRERAPAAAQEALDAPRAVVWAVVFVLVFAVGIALGAGARGQPAAGLDGHARPDDHVPPESATVTVTAP